MPIYASHLVFFFIAPPPHIVKANPPRDPPAGFHLNSPFHALFTRYRRSTIPSRYARPCFARRRACRCPYRRNIHDQIRQHRLVTGIRGAYTNKHTIRIVSIRINNVWVGDIVVC
jgi:hypothetical protein